MRWRAEPGSKLAAARMQVHRLIDCHVEFSDRDKNAVYKALAQAMNLPLESCHAGMFTLAECERAERALRSM